MFSGAPNNTGVLNSLVCLCCTCQGLFSTGETGQIRSQTEYESVSMEKKKIKRMEHIKEI